MRHFSCKVMDCIPLIVILGGTGTGKSKLAIEIAKKLGGEIISADSMQVYKGLDILTNKVTAEERAEVPHHLIDFVSPLSNFTVVDFRERSLSVIDRLLKKSKSPVIVGGTNYYIESILWETLVVGFADEKYSNDIEEDPILKLNKTFELTSGSRGIKRKIEKLGENYSTENSPNNLSISLELSTLMNYVNELLKTIKLNLINDNCHDDVINIFGGLINEESISDTEAAVKLLEDNLKDHEKNSQTLFLSMRCFLALKNCINQILKKFNSNTSVLNSDIISASTCPTSYLSIDKLINDSKEKKSEYILVIIHALIQKLNSLIKTHIPQYENILRKDLDLYFNLSNLQSTELYNLLKNIDPERAACLHPNNKRKILRSLQVWFSTGREHSDILREQQRNGSALGGPLRFKNAIIFWLTADPKILNKRLDDRVHQMFDRGLVKELQDFYLEYHPNAGDFTKGIFQSIGFKEFREYLLLSDEEKRSEEGKKKLDSGIRTLKLVTKRYVKYQNKWIRNRFLRYPDREVPPIFNLDTSDIDHWDELVLKPALDVIMSKIEGKPSQMKPLSEGYNQTKEEIITLKSGEYYCRDCNRTFIGLLQWNTHINSTKHKKVVLKNKPKVIPCASHDDEEHREGFKECTRNLLNVSATENSDDSNENYTSRKNINTIEC